MVMQLHLETLDRRKFVVGAGAAAAIFALFRSIPASAEKPQDFDAAFKSIVGDAETGDSGVEITLPEIAENGNTVPFSVSVESAMSKDDYVKAVHLLSTGNPQPMIATFHFTPLSGAADVSGRMRLAKTQDIVAVAELSNGKFLVGKQMVKVTIGGCGG